MKVQYFWSIARPLDTALTTAYIPATQPSFGFRDSAPANSTIKKPASTCGAEIHRHGSPPGVAVGDASKTRDVLAKYGTVQVFDADGKPVGGSVDANK